MEFDETLKHTEGYFQKFWDIEDGVLERALTDVHNPRYGWIKHVPNSFIFHWDSLSMRERTLIVATVFHMLWEK
jgi:hypothetical protein